MRIGRVFLLSAPLVLAACEVVAPSNPFDPAAPPDAQQPAVLRGAVVLDDSAAGDEPLAAELAEVVVTVLDASGRPRTGTDGDPLTLPLTIDGRRGTFAEELVPGTIRLAIDGVGARFTPPTLTTIDLGPGEIVDVGDLVFSYRPPDGAGPGRIDGEVLLDGGSGGERTVSIFRKEGDTQTLVLTTLTTARGTFSAPGLQAGTYAIAANLDGFTPDYRVDIEIGEAQGQALAHTFVGADALTLHPITAVLLPQLPRVEGTFYTRDDTVPLAVLAFGGVTGMRLQAAACTEPAPACADVVFSDDDAFPDYSATADQALPAVEGRVGVFAQFQARSPGGFVFTSPVFATTVVRDVTPPTITAVSVLGAAPAAEVVATDDEVNFALSVDDTGGAAAVGHVLAEQEPAIDDVVFQPITAAAGTVTVERAVALPVADGRSTAWFFVRDRAGNVSAPARVDIRKDTAPAASLPVVIEAVTPREGRAIDVLVSFDTSGAAELPVEVQLALGSLPADEVSGRQPFVDGGTYTVSGTGVDGETLVVQARLFDIVGNTTEVLGTIVLSLRGALSGTIDQERLGATRALAGAVVRAVAPDGATLGTATTDDTGRYDLPSLPEGRVTVVMSAAGARTATVDAGFLEAGTTTTVDGFLNLQRGSLVGSFRFADLDAFDDRHGNITVEARLVSPTRSAAARAALTGANGDWALDLVPATLLGESYDIIAIADGYASGLVSDVRLDDNGLTVVNPDAADPTTPSPVLLNPLSGDFDLCSTAEVGGPCAALRFTNADEVRVHLRDHDGVTRIRAAVGSLPSEAVLPLSTYDADNDVVVALPDEQGEIGVIVDIERDGGRQVLGPVFVFRDTVPPAAPDVVIARGATARRDGFTNEPFVRATVTTASDDDDDSTKESPLQRSPTFFAATPPSAPLAAGATFCTSAQSCTVLLPSLAGVVEEGRHDLYAFACDAAGNCSTTPGTSTIIYDETPPSALHGVAFAPTGSGIVDAGSDNNRKHRTGSGAYAVSIEVGTARTAAGEDVLDADGLPVRDVDAVALSFVAAIDASDVQEIVGAEAPGTTAVIAGLPLLGGEGTYDIFARFVDAAGNATSIEPNPFTFTLTLDETAPTGRLVLADGSALTNSLSVAARIDGLSESGVLVKLVDDAADCQDSDGYVAAAALPATTSLADADGTQILIACLKDDVGNLGFASDTITLDRQAPSGAVVLDGGAAFSSSRNLVASFQAVSSDVARVKAVLRPAAATITDCADPTGYVAFATSVALSLAVTDPSGTYAVDACFEDAAGNRSAAAASDTILFDATDPVVTMVLNDDEAFTTSSQVRATISATDDLGVAFVGMRFSSSLTFSGNSEGFAVDRAGVVLSAPTVEGSKTVCVEVVDELGRTATDCDDIVLDLSAPTGTLHPPAFATASPFDVTIRSDDLNIASAAVGEGLDCSTATFTSLPRGTTETRSVTLADTTTEGTRSVVACFKDAAGQVARVERTVAFDPNDPALAQPVAPADGAVVPTKRPVFTWANVAGAVRFNLIVRRVANGAVVLNQSNITGLSFTPTSDLPEAALEWIVVATKASGRSSTVSFTGAPRVTPDATAPTAASGITITVDSGRSRITRPAPCAAASPCVNDNTPTLSFTAGTDAIDASLVHTVQVATAADLSFAAPVFSIVRTDGSAFSVGAPLEDGNYRVRVTSTDDAGNSATSATAEFIVDRTPPDVPSFFPLQDPVSSTLLGSIIVGWTAEGATGAVGYRFQLTTEERTFTNPIVDEALAGVLNTSRDVKALLEAGAHVVHQVRVAAVDALGNQSAFAVAGFANDTTPPCGAGKTLTVLGTDATNDFTSTNAVVVDIVCASDPADPFDGPARLQLGCDGNASGKPFIAFTGFATCVLPNPDGVKAVQAIVLDEAGNATDAFSDTITLDRRAPTTPVLSVDNVITNDPSFSFSIAETSTDSNLLRHEFMDGVEITTFDDPRAVVTGNTITLELVDERTYNVRVRGIDRAGNVSPEAIATVTFDITPPTRPDIADNDAPVVVNDDTFTIFLVAPSQDTHFAHYELSTDGGAFVPIAGDGVFTIPLPQDRTSTFALRGVDQAGNAGEADAITVVEDSRNPRPVQLAELPPFTNGGPRRAFSTPTFTARGPYVDVHFARSETAVAADDIDANFDHFEVRATHPTFANFVPLCATATDLCAGVVRADNGDVVDGGAHLIMVDDVVVGFRIPLALDTLNTITVRSVDKAGNVSIENSVTTTEISNVRVTNDDAVEAAASLFGDRLVYIDITSSPPVVRVRLPGPDAIFGTDDDATTALREPALAPSSLFSSPVQVIAQGPDLVVHDFQNGPTRVVLGFHGGDDFDLTTAPVQTLPLNEDPLKDADQPSIWGRRIAFRQAEGGSDTDIYVRDIGADGLAGTGDDLVRRVADDPGAQFFPQISGDNVAFFRCATAACDGANEPRLVIVNAGADRVFGTGDDDIRTLGFTGIDKNVPPQLYTPGTPGRAACRNVVAWSGAEGNKGVHVVAAGPDGFFDPDDPAVQVLRIKNDSFGRLRSFRLYDDVVVANDDFAQPPLEVVTGGRDGCLTRTVDNLSFDPGIRSFGNHFALHDNRIVTNTNDPTVDLQLLELGAERALWPRSDRASTDPNFVADVDGVAFAGGGFFDLVQRRVQPVFSPTGLDDVDSSHGNILTAPGAGAVGASPVFQPLQVLQRGVDGIWGTSDDRSAFLTATRPLSVDRQPIRSLGSTFAIDGDIAVWAGRRLGRDDVVPVLHAAGADQLFGTADDCEVEIDAVPSNGYKFVSSSNKRQVFQQCFDVGCGAVVGAIGVREVSGDVCGGVSATATVVNFGNVPAIEGPRVVYNASSTVRVVEAGPDNRLTQLGDNVERQISFTAPTVEQQVPGISGDRVVWIDARYETPRAILADLADGSERVVSRSPLQSTAVSIDGDLIVWGNVSGDTTDIASAYIGLQPDLPQDQRAAAPTRLRCPQDDVYEENDSIATATPMNSGAALNAIVCRGDTDRYAVDVPAVGCIVRAKARFVHIDGDIDLVLLDPLGSVVASSNGSSDDESIAFTATRPGAHIVGVFGFGGAENAYDVGVTVTCP